MTASVEQRHAVLFGERTRLRTKIARTPTESVQEYNRPTLAIMFDMQRERHSQRETKSAASELRPSIQLFSLGSAESRARDAKRRHESALAQSQA